MDEEEEEEDEVVDDGNDIVVELGAEPPGELVAGLGAGLGVTEIPDPAVLPVAVTETAGFCTWTGLF